MTNYVSGGVAFAFGGVYTASVTHIRSVVPGVLAILAATSVVAAEPDWARFRGPNGSGLSTATGVPTQFGPDKNLLWRLALPQGHSSPIL
ncbi:MAG: hypothetical protein RJA55_2217 [Acidobacteriota bacterium]